MSKYQYDLVVIGGGSGGLVAARVGAGLGARTALVDKERLGGDCLYYGCVPSKTLIHAAKLIHTVRAAGTLVKTAPDQLLEIDMTKVVGRIQGVIERIGQAEQVYVKDVAVRFGRATFLSPHELKLDDTTLTAHSFIVATGSSPRIPSIEGLTDTGYLTNEDVFDLLKLPPALVIVGGGPVGTELAQAFARLGSDVTLVQSAPRILPREEPEMSQAVAEALTGEGVEIVTGARVQKVHKDGSKKVIEAEQNGQLLTFEGRRDYHSYRARA